MHTSTFTPHPLKLYKGEKQFYLRHKVHWHKKMEEKSNKFLETGTTALIDPQELNPKPAGEKAENHHNLCQNPPKSQELVILGAEEGVCVNES